MPSYEKTHSVFDIFKLRWQLLNYELAQILNEKKQLKLLLFIL